MNKIPKTVYIYGFCSCFFLLIGLFAPWIANEPKGSANELIGRVSRLIQNVRSMEERAEASKLQQSLFEVRRNLLGLNNSYEGAQSSTEMILKEKISKFVELAQNTPAQENESFMAEVHALERALQLRQRSLFPLIKKGPVTPLTEHQKKDRPPSSEFLFGTDQIGRDIFSYVVHGIRNSLFFGLFVVFVCFLTGITIGGIMGYFGGWMDLILQRFMEIIGNFPFFLLQLTLLAFIPAHLDAIWRYAILAAIMCAVGWIPYARYTRAEFFRLKNLDFATAAESLGASSPRRFFRHLLPNAMTPNITYIPFDVASTILGLGALSFLGFGEPPGTASLGELLSVAKQSIARVGDLRHWWLALFPGLALFLLTLSFVLFGASIRDFLDPRYSEKQKK